MDLPAGVAYWRAYGLSGDMVGCTPSPVWEFFVNRRNADGPDTSWGTVLDINEDGYADLAAVEYNAAHLYYGGPQGPSTTPSETISTPSTSTASAGDVDGDGFGDMLIYTVNEVVVRRGSSTGTVATASLLDESLSDLPAPLGDLNRDGYGDIGVPVLSSLYVYYGSASGIVNVPTVISNPGPPNFTSFGYSRSAGDVNGDGYGDVIIGYEAGGNALGQGRAFVYLGGPQGVSTSPATTLYSPAGETYGMWVNGGGDVNGDGYADVLVGALGPAREPEVYVYLGSSTGVDVSPQAKLTIPTQWGDIKADVMMTAFDANGDGYWDVVLGAWLDDHAYVFMGGPGGVDETAAATLSNGSDHGLFGFGLSGGDTNGDGYEDLAIGAPSAPTPGPGRIYLFDGSSSGVTTTPKATFTPPPASAFANFGYSIALSTSGS
jgi:hypothetical protein